MLPPRHFASLDARAPGAADDAFLFALYLAARPDLGALPVPASVIEGIARHQQAMQAADYAQRFPDAETWLIEREGERVARLVLERSGPQLRVIDLAVAPPARRCGIARTLLAALQEECGSQQAIVLRVRRDNTAARTLYEGMGFTLLRDDARTQELVWTKNLSR